MAVRVYLGPAATLNEQAVPKGGLKINLTDDQVRSMIARGHVFAGKDGDVLRVKDLKAEAAPTETADKK